MVPKHATDLQDINVVAVYAGEHHALVRTAAGELESFGRPAYGRLGRSDVDVDADTGVGPAKVAVEGLEGPVAGAAAGSAVSGCFSAQMCGLWMCGFGVNSQLGQGDDDSDRTEMTRVKRTKVFNEVEITQLQIGGQHVVMLAVPTVKDVDAVEAAPAGKSKQGTGKNKPGSGKSKDVAPASKVHVDAEKETVPEKTAEDVKSDGEDEADNGEAGASVTKQ